MEIIFKDILTNVEDVIHKYDKYRYSFLDNNSPELILMGVVDDIRKNVMVDLEKIYEISIPADDYMKFETIQDIAEYIQDKLIAKKYITISFEVPEGYVVDTENTCLSSHKIKCIALDWDVIKEWANENMPSEIYDLAKKCAYKDIQLNDNRRVYAYAKLMCIAKYFNGDWKLCRNEFRCISKVGTKYIVCSQSGYPMAGVISFKDEKSCNYAIEMMGDDLKYLF